MKAPGTLRSVACASLMVWSATAQNLMVNGGFETPAVATWVQYALGSTDLTGWAIVSTLTGGTHYSVTR
ncbi:MAG: hypothetical protein HY674_10710 [Chloroflexi bacterium]|nr:hypothetical protein [Chloroflexota bacterium]